VQHSASWLTAQLQWEFMNTCARSLAVLSEPGQLRDIGMIMPTKVKQEFNPVVLEEQNSLAESVAHLGLSVVGLRLQRCMHMLRGWSSRSVLFMSGDADEVKVELDRFHKDWRNFKQLAANLGASTVAKKIHERSQFHLRPVQQVVCAVEETDWHNVSDQFHRFLIQKHARLLSSQMTEDCFNRQKKLKYRASNRRLNLASAWNVLLERKVCSSVHHYTEPPCVEPPSARLEFLPEETFVPKLVGDTVKVLSGVTSFKQEPAWYSPGAERWPARFADVGLMAAAVRHNDFDMSNVWLTSLVNFRYNLLLREKLPDGSFGQPLFAATSVAGSSGFGWPAVMLELPGDPGKFAWRFADRATVDETFVPLFNLEHWEARSVKWLAPASQAGCCAQGDHVWAFCGRAHPTTDAWESLDKVAARQAFWDCKLPALKSFAGMVECEVPPDVSPFDMVWLLVKHVLSTTDEQTLQIMQKRCAALEGQSSESTDVFLEMNVEIDHLDKNDEEELNDSKKENCKAKQSSATFMSSWCQKKQAMTSKAAVTTARKKLERSKYPPYPATMPTQAEAKLLLPPAQCYISRALSIGAWVCHYPPFGRRTFGWLKHGGGDDACRACIRYLWETYCAENALTMDDCPIEGL
jgi:hypothetical protein